MNRPLPFKIGRPFRNILKDREPRLPRPFKYSTLGYKKLLGAKVRISIPLQDRVPLYSPIVKEKRKNRRKEKRVPQNILRNIRHNALTPGPLPAMRS